MNFFQHQDDARRKTGLLIILFCFAVLGIVAMVTVLVAYTIWSGAGDSVSIAQYGLGHYITPELLGKTSLGVSGVIGAVILYKWLQLRGGGKIIAERLGGRLLNPSTSDFNERQLLNVVEEMAIAAGLPVPPVYLLEENGINAFAAGHSQNNAVIGITRTAIEQLNREQLQGVIAHEFSHILHGDILINLRLIAVLSGILFIGQAGYSLMRSSRYSRSKNSSQGALLGLGLIVIGFIGSFFGKMIKAAVSRQREYLADASAVQYTRNPDGIAGALKVIGGSTGGSIITATNTEENSHLFFSNGLKFNLNIASAMSTHPPLSDRIKRIQPTWDGEFIAQAIASSTKKTSKESNPKYISVKNSNLTSGVTSSLAGTIASIGQVSGQAVTTATQIIHSIPTQLLEASRDSYYAQVIVFGLLLDTENSVIKEEQLRKLEIYKGLRDRTEQSIPYLDKLYTEQRLPLIELCVPALKQLSAQQYKQFKKLVKFFVERDGKVDLFEWMLQELLQHYLAGEFNERKTSTKNNISSIRQVDRECIELISLLAQQGHRDQQQAQHAFEQAIFMLELGSGFFLTKEAINLKSISENLVRLRHLKPKLKIKLLNALSVCIKSDNEITLKERELFRLFSSLLDCPTSL